MMTFMFKLYNDEDNKKLMNRIDICAIVYNRALAYVKEQYVATGKNPSKYDVMNSFLSGRRKRATNFGI